MAEAESPLVGPVSALEASPEQGLLSSSPSLSVSAASESPSSLFSAPSGRCVEGAPEVQNSASSSTEDPLSPGNARGAPERLDSRYKSFPRRQESKYFLDSVPHPQVSMKAIATAHLRQAVEQKQEEPLEDSVPDRLASFATGPDINGNAETGSAADPAGATAAATHKGSVMSADLGRFYRKLLGEDWREQIAEMNQETLLGPFNEANDEDISAGGGPATQPTPSVPGDDLNLPDKHHGKVRQRIRRRDVTASKDISDQVADDLHLGEDEEPLITPDDIAEIRATAWIPAGEGLPILSEMELGYHRAWDVGKKGCLAVKVDGIWDSAVKGNKMRFFVMDGTDTESFLTFYTKSDLQAARGLQSEKLGIITAWDMRDGYWNYPKKKIFIQRSDRKNRECILEGFTAEFYDAMLLCIWEMCVQASIEQLKHQRRRERNKRRQSLCGGSSTSRMSCRGAETSRMSAALVTFKDVPRERGKRSEAPRRETSRSIAVMRQAAAVHREVMKQLCAEWRSVLRRQGQADVKTWLRRRRVRRDGAGEAGLDSRCGKDGQACRQRSMRRTVSGSGTSTTLERKGSRAAAWSRVGTHADFGERGGAQGVAPSADGACEGASFPLDAFGKPAGRAGSQRELNGEASGEGDARAGELSPEEREFAWGGSGSESSGSGDLRGELDRDRPSSGSGELGGLRGHVQKVLSLQLEKRHSAMMNGSRERFEAESPTSDWRREDTGQLSSLPLDGLPHFSSSGEGYRHMPYSAGSARGRRKSMAASKRGAGNGISGSTVKLSKYESLNRVPPARPQGNETPLLTPGEMTPRDPEDERPKFG
ncbi:hypothetical protein TGMAS_309190 [Toxoplasma gondii MAS]|uniref:Uncharacterized protein n=1 Tax=Toxoplasma gondii MAS TaxID=943118 RepID=A0A086QJV8_TOXGO|nr:hypothetical protein TGMAS_309190 [Toxoplasma gondii MAS]